MFDRKSIDQQDLRSRTGDCPPTETAPHKSHAMPGVPKQCTGVAVRAESEINVAGGKPVIVVVRRRGDPMGMFDYYEPEPPLSCPVCGAPLAGWQGKDGPCALLVWRQGATAPINQAVPDEAKREPAVIGALRLPAEFEIYTQCCGGNFFVTARCAAPDGLWNHAELETAENAQQRHSERRGDFKKRFEWLAGRAV